MSMQNPSPDIPVFAAIRPAGRRQRGFGLVQVMLILVLVGGALAAGAMLLQSKRPVQQAVTQEQTLRWADEAVAAFAASNARLPCPSPTVHGEEDCTGVNAQGWLPLRTLLGASGTGPQIGPVAYMVYRGGESAHLDLTRPGNAYQPPLIDGSPREIITKDKDGKETGRRRFAAVNGLDLCRSLELAEAAGLDSALARITNQAHVPRNVAYGIAAAGSHAGSTRLDDANAGAGQTMEAPWRQWDSGYDDRVRVRTFDRLGQALGCRLLAGGTGPSSGTPYNVSLAGMDVLAAAVTLHDALALLQASNVDATEAAVQGAVKAQISLIFKLVTTAASLSDQITTLVTSATNLTRSIATCIASLGAMCWEVPLKAAAVVTSIVGLGTKGVTLAAKAASLPFVALALDASVKARDLARRADTGKVPQDLDEARSQLKCTLYAEECDEDTQKDVVYKRDDSGNPVPKKDEYGNPLYDAHGNPLYEIESEIVIPRIGLDKQTQIAKAEWDKMQYQVDKLEYYRLAPWGVASRAAMDSNGEPVRDDNGLPTYELVEIESLGKDGSLRSQIQERIHPQRTCGIGDNSTNWEDCGKPRYRKRVEEWVCEPAGSGGGLYDDDCVEVGTRTETVEGKEVVLNNGTQDRVLKVSYAFDWDVATADAVARRKKVEEWVDSNRREQELAKEIKQFEDNIDTWFKGDDSILAKMLTQLDDKDHCQGRGRGNPDDPLANLPAGDKERQQCINARNAVRYIETCEKPVVVTECTFVGGDGGRYSDSACTDRNGTPKDYVWRETSSGHYETDRNERATCKPNMEGRLAELKRRKAGIADSRAAAKAAYDALPSPWVAYPSPAQPYSGEHDYDWFQWAIETTEDADGNPIKYEWVRSTFTENYTYACKKLVNRPILVPGDPKATPPTEDTWKDNWVEEDSTCQGTRSLPWYAREPYGASARDSSPLLVTDRTRFLGETLQLNELVSQRFCKYFSGRRWNGSGWWWPDRNSLDWWGSEAYPMGLYCQRYPYSRAFEDWQRAKAGAENARKNYVDTKAQFDKLEEELRNMDAGGASGGGPTTQMSFGAEATLEHADSRGSTGPQSPVQP